MPVKKHPDCVIDGRTYPPVMRCNHCKVTQPVQLPVELSALVARSKEFERSHAFCHLSLLALRSKEQQLRETLNELPPSHRAHDATRGKLYDVQAAIRRQEPNPDKWP